MKILTKEQEAAHYNATLKGGITGTVAGLAVGAVAVAAAQRRYHFIRNLTLPMKAFLVTSSGTFAGIIAADSSSREYEANQNPAEMQYRQREAQRAAAEKAGMTFTQRAMEFGRKERYKIVAGSWIASMGVAFALVNRNKYLTGAQKIVQARVYAQFLTVGVLVATAAFEISDSRNQEGRYETIRYLDPSDPEHKRMLEKQVEREGGQGHAGRPGDDLWKEMVAAEEERIKEREARQKHHEHHEHHEKKKGSNGKKSSKHDDTKEDGDKSETK